MLARDLARRHAPRNAGLRTTSWLAVASALAGAAGVLVPVGSAAAAPNASCAGARHVVVRGDTWYGIARRAKVSVTAVLDENEANERDVIRPGDAVCLPSGAAARTPAAQAPGTGCGQGATHTAVAGDTWFGIAGRAGVTPKALLAANGATVRTKLLVGDAVCLPDGASAPSAVAVTLQALPVHGPCWYGDTWHAPRSGGRRHEGIDLLTTPGRYVYAVTDGVLTKRAWDLPGRLAGNAWWLTAADGSGTYFFYAHLSDFAPGLEVGSRVRAGEIIGFVGSTGSSAAPHLHFEIHPGGGGAINPYPAINALGGCKSGAGYRQPNGWTPSGGGVG